ncbi:cell surface A33 antigen isoform X2 [Seriola lalandi dorsalis]|uniref:cell surface A33 antigen isoform X2 n=1 Tax=Seriola lalandi dorsalis TaxID=1841481 RepID=UPI000C6F67E9|nr:cell surface A33 antigen isoform X2 [Seriola lalandi dorsalis]
MTYYLEESTSPYLGVHREAMATKRQFGWRKLFLILTVLPCCRSLEVSIPQKEYEVARGGDITLTCSFIPAQPDAIPAVLTWEVFADNPNEPMKPVASVYPNNVINIGPGYEGRVSAEIDTINHVSTLHLTKVIMQDSRRYQCGVLIPNDDKGTTAAITSLLVLVAPSVPICSIQGKAEYGHNISLTCMSEEGSPKPTYKWTSYSVTNVPRDFPPRSSEKDGVLSLYNISREMSGFYICTSTNRIGSASYNLTLAVLPGSVGEASIAVVIGGVVAGLVLLGILIFCCCRKKGKKNKYAEGAPVQFFEKDESEAGEEYWDDMSHSETKKDKLYEDKGAVPQNNYIAGPDRHKLDDDQHSHSGKETIDVKGSYTDSQRNQDDQHDDYRGSRDRLDDQRDRYGGSRDRLDDKRNYYSGSRDRLDDQRDRYGGSRDRLDDQRDRYGASDRNGRSRDRLDDQRDRYGGSRDRLDDQRDRYGGSRDRLDDQRDRYGGSRDRLDDQRDRYGGSRDRLDDQRDRNGRSRDRPDDQRDLYDGSRDRVVYKDDQYRN